MDEVIVEFKLAKLLKEKGFNKFCNLTYIVWPDEKPQLVATSCYNSTCDDNWYSAPTLVSVLDWLRIDKNLFVSFFPVGDIIEYKIYKNGKLIYENENEVSDVFEEVCKSAIEYCLEQLI